MWLNLTIFRASIHIIYNIFTVLAFQAQPLTFWQLRKKKLTDFDGLLLNSIHFELFNLVNTLNDLPSEQLKGLPNVDSEGSACFEIPHPFSTGQLESLVYSHLLLLYVALISQQK